jgi:hypothetical protein
MTCRDDDLESRIDTKSHARIKVYAFAIDYCLGEILGINSTGEEQVQIVVLGLIISNWRKLVSLPLSLSEGDPYLLSQEGRCNWYRSSSIGTRECGPKYRRTRHLLCEGRCR